MSSEEENIQQVEKEEVEKSVDPTSDAADSEKTPSSAPSSAPSTDPVEKSTSKEAEQEPKQAPQQSKQQPQQQPQPQQQQQQQAGGWSFGSWWNAASNVVAQSVEQYVKPTVSTLTETTKGIVNELVAEEPAPAEQAPSDQQQQSEQQQQPPQQQQQRPNTQPVDLKLFSVMDKGFTMLGDSVDVLGNYLHQGLEFAKTADLQTIATTSIEKAKQVAVHTTEKGLQVGEKIAMQSVDALESVGKTALEYLTVQEEVETDGKGNNNNNSSSSNTTGGKKKRIRPVFSYIPNMTEEQTQSFEEVLNKNYFEENHGPAHLQALERLSIECTLKANKLEQQLSPAQREHLIVLVNKIKALLDEEEEEEDDETKLQLATVKLNDPAVKHGQLLEALTQEAIQKANEMLLAFRQDINAIRPESIIGSIDICHVTASYLDKTLVESAKRLSQLSAVSVEQLLRVVESVMITCDAEHDNEEQAVKKATFLFAVCRKLAEELSNTSNSFIDSVRALATESKTTFDEYAKRSEKDLEESKKCAEDIDTKTNLHVNHLYMDGTNAVSNIQDCKKFLFPICKSLILAGLAEAAKNTPEQQQQQQEKEEVQEEEQEQ